MADLWHGLWACERCGQGYRATSMGHIGKRCICGAGLARDVGDAVRELLAGDQPLELLEPRLRELLSG
jgi:PHP family Zn ribbon phosphoesterase